MDTQKTTCLIWGTPAVSTSEAGDASLCTYTSPRAGGAYTVHVIHSDRLSALNEISKVKLSSQIVTQNLLGSPLTISKKIFEDIEGRRISSPSGRGDMLLRYVAKRARRLGDFVNFPSYSSDGNNVEHVSNTLEALAWSECASPDELRFLFDFLSKREFVEDHHAERRMKRLTILGHERLSLLEYQNADSSQAFVAMWFHEDTAILFAQGIEPAIREAGFQPLRIDKKDHNNKIDDEIIAEIRRSRFLVADFTSERDKPRGGVYFEAGFAKGLNIPVIWTCKADLIDQVHFDTRQFAHIVWQDAAELKEKLVNRIRATIGQGPLR